MFRKTYLRLCLLCVTVIAVAIAGSAFQNTKGVKPEEAPKYVKRIIVRGSDYLETKDGTTFDFGKGPIALQGKPIGNGPADTVVERKADVILNPQGEGTVPVEMVALSMVSKSPMPIGPRPCNVTVTLDPSKHSSGRLLIKEDTEKQQGFGKGTFTSSFEVYYIASFTDAKGQACAPPKPGHFPLKGKQPIAWQHDAPPRAFLVQGPRGDEKANLHSGLKPTEMDFFPGSGGGGPVDQQNEKHPFAVHVTTLAFTHEKN